LNQIKKDTKYNYFVDYILPHFPNFIKNIPQNNKDLLIYILESSPEFIKDISIDNEYFVEIVIKSINDENKDKIVNYLLNNKNIEEIFKKIIKNKDYLENSKYINLIINMISLRPNLIDQIIPSDSVFNEHLPSIIINNFDKEEVVDYTKKIDKNTLLDIYYMIHYDYSNHKNFKKFIICVIGIYPEIFKIFEEREERIKAKKAKDYNEDEYYNEILTYYNEVIEKGKFDLKNK